jgi:adenosylhomocysteine nucleosidase
MQAFTSPACFIFCALQAEAAPVIEHWKLKKQSTKAFSLYSDDTRVLVVTGIGKTSMASAIGYTLAHYPHIHSPLLLNFGIAGHSNQDLGSLWLVDRAIDQENGRSFFPQFSQIGKWPSSSLVTTTTPVRHYQENSLHDMEATAFFESAIKFTTLENIHALKIVSDNADATYENVSASKVTDWVKNQLSQLDGFLSHWQMEKKGFEPSSEDTFDMILTSCHFSQSNRLQLERLRDKWRVLKNEAPDWQMCQARTAKGWIDWLAQEIELLPFRL